MGLNAAPMAREGSNGTMRSPALQDAFLAEVKRQAVPVVIYLVNGFQLKGLVRGFDAFTIVLEFEHKPHLVYKHAVSTISPQGPLHTTFLGDQSREGSAP